MEFSAFRPLSLTYTEPKYIERKKVNLFLSLFIYMCVESAQSAQAALCGRYLTVHLCDSVSPFVLRWRTACAILLKVATCQNRHLENTVDICADFGEYLLHAMCGAVFL